MFQKQKKKNILRALGLRGLAPEKMQKYTKWEAPETSHSIQSILQPISTPEFVHLSAFHGIFLAHVSWL